MDLNKLGNRIKELRQGTGLSQEDFALSIEMDRTYYSAIENGKHNITIQNLYKIANGLKITLSELLKDFK
jgi:transcriptional regulator with XRE-family HTH domain